MRFRNGVFFEGAKSFIFFRNDKDVGGQNDSFKKRSQTDVARSSVTLFCAKKRKGRKCISFCAANKDYTWLPTLKKEEKEFSCITFFMAVKLCKLSRNH